MNSLETESRVAPCRTLRLLLVENNPADAELCVYELRKAGFEPVHEVVQTPEDFTRAIRSGDYDVVLADFNLPGWNGMAALDRLKEEGKDIPFILVTGTLGEEQAVDCIKKGAADYVLKDRLARLPVAVRGALEEQSLREEQARAEAALKASEERYRTLYERNLAGVYSTTLDGRVIDLNDACARMFGYASRDEAVNRTLWDVAPNRADMRALIGLVKTQGSFTNLEVRLRRVDGRAVWVLGSASLLEAEGREPLIEGTLLDVTERKQLEEQLRQAQRLEAVGRLAGGVAHDFNNMLTAIVGYSEMVLEQVPPDSRLHRHVTEIKKAGDRATSLTRQLLAFSRQQVLAPQVLDLNAVFLDMAKMLRRLIGDDIELETHLDPNLGRVKADPSQIEQVILNLALNARDALPGGGRVRIETINFAADESFSRQHVGLKPGPYIALAVSDTGCGMDAETKARIFEPFFTTKEKGKGTGLGLSTVYGVVKQSGGYLEVESEPGHGSTFRVYLPRVEEEPALAANRPAAAPAARGTETILLVEDDDSLRLLARTALVTKGYKVLEAACGDEALAIGEQCAQPIGLLLTDMVMPQMTGRELARRLGPIHPETRVLFMSGYPGARGPDALEPDMPFLQKPFTPDSLTRKIREMLDA